MMKYRWFEMKTLTKYEGLGYPTSESFAMREPVTIEQARERAEEIAAGKQFKTKVVHVIDVTNL
jgi:hypothetical protein